MAVASVGRVQVVFKSMESESLTPFTSDVEVRPSMGPREVQRVSLSEVRLGASLGQGAFCEVVCGSWASAKQQFQRPLAVKRLRADLPPSNLTVGIKDVEREISILSQMAAHEHIVRIVASGEHDGRPFMVMERLTPFEARLETWELEQQALVSEAITRRLSVVCGLGCVRGCARRRQALWVARVRAGRDIVSALAHLHTAAITNFKVVYRDLKPANLGFDGERLVLFDFGLAKLMPLTATADDFRMTPDTGSTRYMAPEVAKGGRYDEAADVFSFAILLWHILSLETPFSNLTPQAHRRDILIGGQRPYIPRAWPPGLRSLLNNCWAAKPSSRISADDACAVLERELLDATALLV